MALKIPETITEEELFKLVNDPKIRKNLKKRCIYLMLFYEGLRISELVKLNPKDYDPKTKLLWIRQSKRDKDRKIPINPRCVRCVNCLPIRSEKAKDKGIRAIQRVIARDCERVLGIKGHPHLFRHSAGSYYLKIKRWDIREVQRFLGHSKIATTEIYTHVNPDDLTKLMWGDTEN